MLKTTGLSMPARGCCDAGGALIWRNASELTSYAEKCAAQHNGGQKGNQRARFRKFRPFRAGLCSRAVLPFGVSRHKDAAGGDGAPENEPAMPESLPVFNHAGVGKIIPCFASRQAAIRTERS